MIRGDPASIFVLSLRLKKRISSRREFTSTISRDSLIAIVPYRGGSRDDSLGSLRALQGGRALSKEEGRDCGV